MVTNTSNGVEIKVYSAYHYESINDLTENINTNKEFEFGYHIEIKNKNNFSIQLLKRHWIVFDSIAPFKIVDGDGVVGEQPIIDSDDTFSYSSHCYLKSELGYMQGHYIMKNLLTNSEFKVEIPKFNLTYPFKNN